MIIINLAGVVELAIAFGAAFGVGHLTGLSAEGPLMLIAGPLAIACDLGYRLARSQGHWFHPGCGGSMFYLPVWLFGILWLVLGAMRTLNGGA